MEDRRIVDMDGNELKVGDRVLFATHAKTIARATITYISDGKYPYVKLNTLNNRYSTMPVEKVLLDKGSKDEI